MGIGDGFNKYLKHELTCFQRSLFLLPSNPFTAAHDPGLYQLSKDSGTKDAPKVFYGKLRKYAADHYLLNPTYYDLELERQDPHAKDIWDTVWDTELLLFNDSSVLCFENTRRMYGHSAAFFAAVAQALTQVEKLMRVRTAVSDIVQFLDEVHQLGDTKRTSQPEV